MTLESTPISIERFMLSACFGGFRIRLLGDWENSPLVRALLDHDESELTRTRPGPLPLIVGGLMARASQINLLLEPKGRLRDPVLHLSARPTLDPVQGVRYPFAALSGRYAAHWGLTDLYPGHKAALVEALESQEPFDTGEFGAKKEIEFARLRRLVCGGALNLGVRCESDDGVASADTAFWTAAGGNSRCSSGEDALLQLGLDESTVVNELKSLAATAYIGDINEVVLHVELPPGSTLNGLLDAIGALVDDAQGQLERRHERLIELARNRLAELRVLKGR